MRLDFNSAYCFSIAHLSCCVFFFFQAEDGIRDLTVTGVQTCALPICVQSRRIGVLTGGGDAPGLNAVIRAVVKAAATCNCEVIGLEDSFDGLIEADRDRKSVV